MPVDLDGGTGRDHLVLSQGAWSCQRGVRFGDHLYLRTWHDGYHGHWADEMLFDVARDPHETDDLWGPGRRLQGRRIPAGRVDLAQLDRTGLDDPMDVVRSEGGPFHVRGHSGRTSNGCGQRGASTGLGSSWSATPTSARESRRPSRPPGPPGTDGVSATGVPGRRPRNLRWRRAGYAVPPGRGAGRADRLQRTALRARLDTSKAMLLEASARMGTGATIAGHPRRRNCRPRLRGGGEATGPSTRS